MLRLTWRCTAQCPLTRRGFICKLFIGGYIATGIVQFAAFMGLFPRTYVLTPYKSTVIYLDVSLQESGWLSGYPTSVTQVQPWPRVVCALSFSRSQSNAEGFSPGTPLFLSYQNRLSVNYIWTRADTLDGDKLWHPSLSLN